MMKRWCLSLVFFGVILASQISFAELPDAPSAKIPPVDGVVKAMGEKVCDNSNKDDKSNAVGDNAGSKSSTRDDCDVTPEIPDQPADVENTNHFYMDVMMSWEHAFGSSDWGKKIFYSGAYRVVDKKTGRQYDLFRFDNEQGLPINETADVGTRRIHDSDYINDVKVYQTQQKDKDGKYADDDDDITKHSKFYGEMVDEKDYGRRLHYFLAIPVGWDRSYELHKGKFDITSDNEVAVGGLAYAGIFQDDGTTQGHFGVNLIRTINSVSFNFAVGDNSFTVTPMEFTNSCAAFHQGVSCEWEASGTFEYQNEKTGIGITAELSHKSGLSAYSPQTQPENVFRIGVSIDPLKTAYGIKKAVKKGVHLLKGNKSEDKDSDGD